MKHVILAAALVLAGVAHAHQMEKGPNGGQVVDLASHHIEFVSSGTDLTFYLTDEKDRPVASAGAKSARAIVQEGGKTTNLTLEPAAPNKLVARLPQPLNAGARVVISTTLADGRALQARFVRN